MARTMLNEAKLLDKLWKEVVHIVVYNLKKSQIRFRTTYTPYELRYGKIAYVKHLKILVVNVLLKRIMMFWKVLVQI